MTHIGSDNNTDGPIAIGRGDGGKLSRSDRHDAVGVVKHTAHDAINGVNIPKGMAMVLEPKPMDPIFVREHDTKATVHLVDGMTPV